jgi:hypothetical protein
MLIGYADLTIRGSNPGGEWDFPDPFTLTPRLTQTSCTIGTGSPSLGYSGRGVVLTTHDLLSPRGVECEYEYTYPCFSCMLALHVAAQRLPFFSINTVNDF